MRAYLVEFFKEFSYTQADTEALLTAYDKIMANEQASSCFSAALAAYDADQNCDYGTAMHQARKAGDAVGIHNYQAELLLFICFSRKLLSRYAECGLPREIWHNSMLDLRYKLEECQAVCGICGSFVAGWFPGFFNLTRFALGRLQFEIHEFDNDYKAGELIIAKGSKAINMHIPRSGEPLSKQLYEDAFARAKEFYKGTFPTEQPVPFVCHSWLLYPETANFVPEHLNTYKFLSEFTIMESHYNDGEDLWRLFDTMERHPDRLPADTSLRRAFVAHLKNGGRVGWGLGILFR
ncbi:MAG: hypothetical protein IJW70_02425 [Clostridia bacterium]|nr:hypothetical protein [Clostridia bacterium]